MTRASMTLHSLYVAFVCLYGSASGLEHWCTPHLKLTQRQGVCGNRLTALLELACILPNNILESLLMKKRNAAPSNKIQDMEVLKEQIMEAEHFVNNSLVDTVEVDDETNEDVTIGDTNAEGVQGTQGHELTKGEALSFLAKRGEYREQNVVCECCVFRCTVSEMREYCSKK